MSSSHFDPILRLLSVTLHCRNTCRFKPKEVAAELRHQLPPFDGFLHTLYRRVAEFHIRLTF